MSGQYVGGQRVRPLTEGQAIAAYEAVCTFLEGRFGYEAGSLSAPGRSHLTGRVIPQRQGAGRWPTGPVLCEDFEDRGSWAVVWEEGPFEWSLYVSEAIFTKELVLAPVVFAEPFHSFSLGLYRDTTGL